MDRRTKIIILGVLLLIALLLLGWLLWGLGKAVVGPGPVAPAPTETLPPSETTTPEVRKPTLAETERIATASVQSVSKTFAERYGSFSNESDFANLADLLPLMTDRFAAETRAYIETASAGTEYYGVTTHVVSIDVSSQDDAAGTARVTIETQREEAKGSMQNVTVKYQTLVLDLVKVGEDWRIDSATWK